MILNLNKLSFAKYGTVLLDRLPRRGFPDENLWPQQLLQVTREKQLGYCLPNSEVFLDFEAGMTILAVSEDAKQFSYFYLDKPVRLNAGVFFSIVPFQEQCSVRWAMPPQAQLLRYRDWKTTASLSITRALEVINIYTLFYQEKERGFFFKGESHPALELTYVDKGAMHNVVGGVDWVLKQGELMIFGENQWHMQYADMDSTVNFITVSFDVRCAEPELLLNRRFCADQQMVQLLRQILEEQDIHDRFSNDMIISRLQQLLLLLLRQDGERPAPQLQTQAAIHNENELINRALSYIAENVCEKISVTSVAEAVDISPSYLTALFHKCLQISPGEYIRRMKLEESKNLIRAGKLNITQIAQTLKYSTVHHFSRQFKEKYGITPTQYAKAMR